MMNYDYYYSINGQKWKKMNRRAANKSVYSVTNFKLGILGDDDKIHHFAGSVGHDKFFYSYKTYTRERRPYTFGKLCRFFDKGIFEIPRLKEYHSK